MLAGTLVLLVFSADPSAPPPKPGPDEAAIKRLVDSFRQAVERERPAELLSLFWPEALVFEHGEVDRSARQFVEQRMALRFRQLDLRWVGEENSGRVESAMAYVAQRARIEARIGGEAPARAEHTFTFVLRKKEGGWRIAHLHWSVGEPAPAPPDGGVRAPADPPAR